MNIVGWMMVLFGGMVLTGEHLCVEVAWRCMDYNQIYTALGALMIGVGMITVMMGVDDDR